MKIFQKLVPLILVIFLFTGCTVLNYKNLPTISSLNKIRFLNDSLFLDFKLDIPYKTLNKKLVYEFIPILIINDIDTISLKKKEIYGEKIQNKKPQVKYKYGGEFIHSDTIITETIIEKVVIIDKSQIRSKDAQMHFLRTVIFEGRIVCND